MNNINFQSFMVCRQFNISVPWLVVASAGDNRVVGRVVTNFVVGALVVLGFGDGVIVVVVTGAANKYIVYFLRYKY